MTRPAENEPPASRNETAADWCVRLAEDRLTLEEERAFDTWMAQPENARAFERAVGMWRAVNVVADTPEFVPVRTAALESFRKANHRRWAIPANGRLVAVIAAAVALLMALAVTVVVLNLRSSVIETSVGERRLAVLEDGSRISMDAASAIDLRLDDDRRDLVLRAGRARFDVAHDPLRPFTVTAGDKLVVATGTSFSVELLGDDVRVVLFEGHVEVLDRTAGSGRMFRVPVAPGSPDQALTPGRELVASAAAGGRAQIVDADITRSLAWESGQLNFENEPLAAAVERVNRYIATPITIADPRIAATPIDGVFTAGNRDAFVEAVTALHPVRAEPDGDNVRLRAR